MTWEDQVMEAGLASMDNTHDGPIKAVKGIKKLLERPNLNEVQRAHGLFNMARAFQHGGDFAQALNILNEIKIPLDFQHRISLKANIRLDQGSCLSALGQHTLAAERAKTTVDSLHKFPDGTALRGPSRMWKDI